MDEYKRYIITLDIYTDTNPETWNWFDLLRPEWNEFILDKIRVESTGEPYSGEWTEAENRESYGK